MTGTQSEKSPLARLVLLLIFLSIAGSIVAGVNYYAVDLPAQKAVNAPANTGDFIPGIFLGDGTHPPAPPVNAHGPLKE